MPDSTPNLDLLKYDTIADKNRYFNINESMNDNWDKIDAFCKNLSNKADNSIRHISNKSNPHSVTKAQVGLGNVDNTSDLNKPVSNAVVELLESDYQALAEKNEVNGYAGLNEEKKVPCKLLSAAKLAYETGEVMTDEEIFNQILNRKHSTFDRSKFTKVGSPIITSDGIYQAVSASNYAYKDGLDISTDNGFKLYARICPKSYTANGQDIFFFNVWNGVRVYSQTVNGQTTVTFAVPVNNVRKSFDANSLGADEYVNIYLKVSSGNSIFEVRKLNGTLLPTVDTWSNPITTSLSSQSYNALYLARYSSSNYNNTKIDLKYLKLTDLKDNVLFSGNKTGIDTIKAINFDVTTNKMKAFVYDTHTVYANSDTAPTELYNADGTIHLQSASEWQIVTTTVDDATTYDVQYNGNSATYTSGSNITSVANPPLPFVAGCKITEDGILSPAVNNGLIKSIPFNNKSFVIEVPFYKISSQSSSTFFRLNNGILILQNGNALNMYIPTSLTGASSATYLATPVISNGFEYLCKLVYDQPTKTLSFLVYKDGTLVNPTDNSVTLLSDIATQNIYTYTTYGGNAQGTVDLNKLKAYVESDLAWQPCLKIPYTDAGNGKGYNASTGSKIVNAIYRDRVSDMYEQFGYAPYYTLSDTNFTLPQGEIYGYIEKRARDIAHPIAQPFFRFSDEINDDEVRLEGAEVDKGLYLAIEQDPYLSALCTAGSTTDKICLPDFRNRVIYGDVASGYVEPELPNVTGKIDASSNDYNAEAFGEIWSATIDGAFEGIFGSQSATADTNGGTMLRGFKFDASRSSSIYKDNGTVKTAGVKARWLCRWK